MLLEVVLRLFYRLYPQMVTDAWEESEHKRDKDGKFAATEGSVTTKTSEKPSGRLYFKSKSGIMKEQRNPSVPAEYKCLTDESIRNYFTYQDGECIATESFQSLSLQARQEVVRGFEKAEQLFGGIVRLRSVTCENLGTACGSYDPQRVSISFDPSNPPPNDDYFGTAVHEVVHHMQCRGDLVSKSILRSVWLSRDNPFTSKDWHTGKMIREFVEDDSKYGDADEIVAYAYTAEVTGIHANELSKAIIAQCRKKGSFTMRSELHGQNAGKLTRRT